MTGQSDIDRKQLAEYQSLAKYGSCRTLRNMYTRKARRLASVIADKEQRQRVIEDKQIEISFLVEPEPLHTVLTPEHNQLTNKGVS